MHLIAFALKECSETEKIHRLSSLINESLTKYYERFGWQPRNIIITGGEAIPFYENRESIQQAITLDRRWKACAGYGRVVIVNSYEQMCLAQARGALSFIS